MVSTGGSSKGVADLGFSGRAAGISPNRPTKATSIGSARQFVGAFQGLVVGKKHLNPSVGHDVRVEREVGVLEIQCGLLRKERVLGNRKRELQEPVEGYCQVK